MPPKREDQDLARTLAAIQQAYWEFDASEKSRLCQGKPTELPWPSMLRLNHLCCMETLGTAAGQEELQSEETRDERDLTEGLDLRFWPALLAKLASPDSPYRPRPCSVWQGAAGASNSRDADLGGWFSNASLSHFGSLEVIRLDNQQKPKELAFVALDELRGVILAPSSIFRAVKLLYDDGRDDEIVWIPLLYGFSWQSSRQSDRDGRLTRFVSHTAVPGLKWPSGIGIGHQDFVIDNQDRGSTLFGLGSIAEIMVALEITDPKFDVKCRARGLDPERIRREILPRAEQPAGDVSGPHEAKLKCACRALSESRPLAKKKWWQFWKS